MGYQPKPYIATVRPYRHWWNKKIRWELVDARGGLERVLIRGTRKEVEKVAAEVFDIEPDAFYTKPPPKR